MTEADWLSEIDVFSLLDYVSGEEGYDRKERLFSLACYRRVRRHCLFAESAELARVLQRFVDGKATAEQMQASSGALPRAIDQSPVPDGTYDSAEYRAYRYWPDKIARHAAEAEVDTFAAAEAAITLGTGEDNRPSRGQTKMVRVLVKLARCIFGNPFRPVRIDPAWTAWNDGTVRRIAEGIYQDRAFDRLPILADALLDAGCDDEQLLEHCRSAGPHARGCFALDVILGKA